MPDMPPKPPRIQEPTDIGEESLNTRNMLSRRSGRPRSATSISEPAAPAAMAARRVERSIFRRPVAIAPQASSADPPATPPSAR